MLIKTPHALGSILLGLAISAVSAAPVFSEPTTGKIQHHPSEVTGDQVIYLTQSLGHMNYPGATRKTWSSFKVGTIRAIVGDVTFVTLEDGTSFQQRAVFTSDGNVRPGSNVLVVQKDGKYRIVDVAHSPWVLKLTEDYGYKLAADKKLEPSYQARTAPIWRSFSTTSVTGQRTIRTQTPRYSGVGGDAPVPALW